MELMSSVATLRLTESELQAHPAWWGLPEGHFPLRGLLGARLTGEDGSACGVFMVSDKSGGGYFTEEDEAVIVQLASLASLAIRQMEAREEAASRAVEAEQAQAILEGLMQSVPVGITIADTSGTVRMVSRYGERLSGREGDSLRQAKIGSHGSDWGIYHPGGDIPAEGPELPLARVLATGNPIVEEEWHLRRPDGTGTPILTSASPIRNQAGEMTAGVIVWHDFAERKRLEESLRASEKRIRSILGSITECYYRMDRDWRIVEMNGKAAAFFGTTPDALLGRIYLEAFPMAAGSVFVREYGRALAEGISVRFEAASTAVAGWVEVHAVPDDAGLSIYFRDITERKKAEEELRLSEESFRSIFELSGTAKGEAEQPSGRLLRVNGKFAEITGYSTEELLTMRIVDFTHPDDVEDDLRRYKDLFLHGTDRWSGEKRYIRKDGKTIWVRVTGTLVRDRDGRPLKTYADIEEITGRKLVEEELRRSETEFRSIFNLSSTGKAQADVATWRFIRVNPAFCCLTGYSEEELIRMTFRDLTHPDDRDRDFEAIERVAAGEAKEWRSEKRYIRKDGKVIWVEVLGTAICGADGRPVTTVAHILDTTERREAEEALRRAHEELEARVAERTAALAQTVEALRRSEERYALSIAAINNGVWEMEVATGEVYLSPAWKEIHGFADDELPHGYKTWLRLLHPDDADATTAAFTDFVEGRADTYQPLYRGLHRDGSWRWIASRAIAVRGPDGKAVRITGTITDVTDRITAESALAESEERLKTVLQALPVGVLLLGSDGEPVFSNAAMARIRGDLAPTRFFRDVRNVETHEPVAPEDLPSSRALSAGETLINEIFEVEAWDGTKKVVLDSAVPVPGASGDITGVVVIDEDITEFRKLQQQLLQAQKMESIGLLAGGVAHDFNNLLTAINGYSELLLESLPPHDPFAVTAAQEILAAGKRAAELTFQLLAFSRKQTINPKPHLVNATIRQVTRLLGRIIGEDVRLSTRFSATDMTVMVDGPQFDQVLVNLATNARDAMPRGGELVISTSVAELDHRAAAEIGLDRPGRYAVIGVRDTGCGMDAATRERIFEPFFTTKGVGRGTGLGLSIIYGIVTQHKGGIRIESEPGRGSEFLIYLPLADVAAEEGASAGTETVAVEGATILIVEDDPIVRVYLRTVLGRAGYAVREAANADEALQVYSATEEIDLVLTDVVMPGRNGRELAEEIRKIDPRAAVIFVSGYTRDIINRHGIADGGIDFLTKPVDRKVLLRKVYEVLSRRAKTVSAG